uniref:CPCC family cysteine-rich protein n=1 Tax=Paenibacillus sp. FSL H8-0537 TaxID=2921399 RepID=UPI004053D00D
MQCTYYENIDPQYYSSPNGMTLVQARENFIYFGAVDKSSVQFLEANRLELYSKPNESSG